MIPHSSCFYSFACTRFASWGKCVASKWMFGMSFKISLLEGVPHLCNSSWHCHNAPFFLVTSFLQKFDVTF